MLAGLLLAIKNYKKIICPVDMLNALQLHSMGTDLVWYCRKDLTNLLWWH